MLHFIIPDNSEAMSLCYKPVLTQQNNPIARSICELICNITPVIVYGPPLGSDFCIVKPRNSTILIDENQNTSYIYSYDGFEYMMTQLPSEKGGVILSSKLRHTGDAPVRMVRVNCIHGNIDISNKEIFPGSLSLFYGPNDHVSSFRSYEEAICKIANKRWSFINDPFHQEDNWAICDDVGVIKDVNGQQALVLGFAGPGKAFGEIGVKTCLNGASEVYAAMMLDNILMAPGEQIQLDNLCFFYGDWQTGLKHWAMVCAKQLGSRKPIPGLVGYCSWYQHERHITQQLFEQAIDQFVAFSSDKEEKALMQLDDGYQVMPGVWNPNSKFGNFSYLPQKITRSNFIPGLWIAPTTVFHTHPILNEYPNIIQRNKNGEPCALSNWWWCEGENETKYNTYFLEPEHPIAKQLMAQAIENAVKSGFKYLKIDFVQNICQARDPYDHKKTAFESLRDLFKLFRDAAGEETLICACIGGLGRYALGYVDTLRIDGDTQGSFEYVKSQILNFIIKSCALQEWLLPDPDVFYMRQMAGLSMEETWILTGTIGMLGSVFLTSDIPMQWDWDSAQRVKYFWQDHGLIKPSRIEFSYDAHHQVTSLVSYFINHRKVAVYNWDNDFSDRRIDLESDRLNILEVFPDDVKVKLEGSIIVLCNMPPHSMRIVRVDDIKAQ